MIIASSEKTVIVFTEALRSINVHSDGKRIMACFRDSVNRDIILGSYDSEEKAAVVFGTIAYHLQKDAAFYYLPENNDPALIESAKPPAPSGFKGKNMLKTTGKTK